MLIEVVKFDSPSVYHNSNPIPTPLMAFLSLAPKDFAKLFVIIKKIFYF